MFDSIKHGFRVTVLDFVLTAKFSRSLGDAAHGENSEHRFETLIDVED